MLLAVTPALREHLTKNFKLAAEASENDARELAGKHFAAGEISYDQLKAFECFSNPASPAEQRIKAIADQAAADAVRRMGGITGGFVDQALDTRGMFIASPGVGASDSDIGGNAGFHSPNPAKAYAMSGQGTGTGDGSATGGFSNTRVKSPLEGYDATKRGADYSQSKCPWVKAAYGNRPVMSGDMPNGRNPDEIMPRTISHPSAADKAVAGSWFKFQVNLACRDAGIPAPRHYRLTDHDKQIVDYTLRELPFCGVADYNEEREVARYEINNRKMSDFEVKAVLDDSLSGGINAAPIAFDDAVIITPLLNGELFPLVNLVNVARGRRINGFSMSNPTFTWGIYSGTEIPLFNTDSFLAAFNTNIYNAVGSMELGLDFESDSPVAVGDIVIQRYGQQALTTLDYVVALGDGVTQPLGVFNTSGVSTVTPDNTTTGPPSVSDYLTLLFTIGKAFRNEADRNRLVYISNDTTYRRSRNIKVDPSASTTDQRLINGMNVEDYYTFGHPHKVQNDIANGSCAMANLARYRMYRRLGLQVRVEAGGKELALKNQRLIVVRMRLGGQMELAGAMSKWTNGQS